MTIRQQILKWVYPFFQGISRLAGKSSMILLNKKKTTAPVSFFQLSFVQNDGTKVEMERFRGKKILVVNTASDCGYTSQYEDLQKLYADYQNLITIIGFPANDFKEQEKGSDAEIAEFCKVNFGVSFPLAKKSTVIKGAEQNPVFKWLSSKSENGWNDQEPIWNFSKYLLDEEGLLLGCFGPAVSPWAREIRGEVEKAS